MVQDMALVFRIAALAALITGCALFPDVSGLASADAGGGDVAPQDAGALDAGWCASQGVGVRFCSDFDESSSAAQGYDLESQQGVGGSLQIDTSSYVSAPHSALGVANPFGAGQTSGDRLSKSLWLAGATPATITCSFQWNPVALSKVQNDYAQAIEIALYADAAATQPLVTYSLNMLSSGELELVEYRDASTAPATFPTGATILLGRWTNVSLSISSAQQTYSVTVGTTNASGSLSQPVPTSSRGALEVGPAYFAAATATPSPGWTFGYDDVLCQ